MFGPGEYVPDPTEGIVDVKDLPTPQLVAYSRNHKHTPCPRCGHLAYRHKSDQRTLHDLAACRRELFDHRLRRIVHLAYEQKIQNR
jgi:hypothetical protein